MAPASGLFEPVLAALDANGVRSVVVGGVATVLHGHARLTADLDLFAEDPIPFGDLWDRAVEVQLASVSVRIASIDDLIAMKRSAGRPQDLADIEALEIIKSRGDAR